MRYKTISVVFRTTEEMKNWASKMFQEYCLYFPLNFTTKKKNVVALIYRNGDKKALFRYEFWFSNYLVCEKQNDSWCGIEEPKFNSYNMPITIKYSLEYFENYRDNEI
jgi:hypothetical protein